MNKSGFTAVEAKIVVQIDEIGEKTAGGLYLPEGYSNNEAHGEQEAFIVSIGPNAFWDWAKDEDRVHDNDPINTRRIPAVGDTVLIAKFGGMSREGQDGKFYRIIRDVDICTLVEK